MLVCCASNASPAQRSCRCFLANSFLLLGLDKTAQKVWPPRESDVCAHNGCVWGGGRAAKKNIMPCFVRRQAFWISSRSSTDLWTRNQHVMLQYVACLRQQLHFSLWGTNESPASCYAYEHCNIVTIQAIRSTMTAVIEDVDDDVCAVQVRSCSEIFRLSHCSVYHNSQLPARSYRIIKRQISTIALQFELIWISAAEVTVDNAPNNKCCTQKDWLFEKDVVLIKLEQREWRTAWVIACFLCRMVGKQKLRFFQCPSIHAVVYFCGCGHYCHHSVLIFSHEFPECLLYSEKWHVISRQWPDVLRTNICIEDDVDDAEAWKLWQ